jgi:hypothetical protein
MADDGHSKESASQSRFFGTGGWARRPWERRRAGSRPRVALLRSARCKASISSRGQRTMRKALGPARAAMDAQTKANPVLRGTPPRQIRAAGGLEGQPCNGRILRLPMRANEQHIGGDPKWRIIGGGWGRWRLSPPCWPAVRKQECPKAARRQPVDPMGSPARLHPMAACIRTFSVRTTGGPLSLRPTPEHPPRRRQVLRPGLPRRRVRRAWPRQRLRPRLPHHLKLPPDPTGFRAMPAPMAASMPISSARTASPPGWRPRNQCPSHPMGFRPMPGLTAACIRWCSAQRAGRTRTWARQFRRLRPRPPRRHPPAS